MTSQRASRMHGITGTDDSLRDEYRQLKLTIIMCYPVNLDINIYLNFEKIILSYIKKNITFVMTVLYGKSIQ